VSTEAELRCAHLCVLCGEAYSHGQAAERCIYELDSPCDVCWNQCLRDTLTGEYRLVPLREDTELMCQR